jgi:hypothetical protein
MRKAWATRLEGGCRPHQLFLLLDHDGQHGIRNLLSYRILRFNSSRTMPSHATRSVRVTEIPKNVGEQSFADTAKRLSPFVGKRGLFSASSPSAAMSNRRLLTSLCPQFGEQVGTITLPSVKVKQQALKDHGTDWRFDDVFDGVTVLYSSPKPDLECVVTFIPLRSSNWHTDLELSVFVRYMA